MSHVALLNEYHQKHKLKPMPVFTHTRAGGQDHQPLWKGSVQVGNQHFHSTQSYPNKSLAKEDAAKQAMEFLLQKPAAAQEKEEESKSKPESKPEPQCTLNSWPRILSMIPSMLSQFDTLIAVDIENQQDMRSFQPKENELLLVFVSRSCPLYDSWSPSPSCPHVLFLKTECTRKDACDHFLSYAMSQILLTVSMYLFNYANAKVGADASKKKIVKVYILSRDHFASVLQDIVQEQFQNTKNAFFEVKHVVSQVDLNRLRNSRPRP